MRAEAGVGWDAFVDWTLGRGLAGLENLALIPGLVGAAPIQNIGAYGVEVAESIDAVEAWDRDARGRSCGSTARDAPSAIATASFKREPGRWIVTARRIPCCPARRPLRLDYAGVREELAAAAASREPTPQQVADAVRRLRRRKLPDPAVIGNAGSFFKNPVVTASFAAQLRERTPGRPGVPGRRGAAASCRPPG